MKQISSGLCQISVATAMAAGILATPLALAHSLGGAIRTENWSFTGIPQVDVPGMVSNVITKPANQRLVITFSAGCAVDAPEGVTTGWLDVDIVLTNANTGAVVLTVAPTSGSADAFCSANGKAGIDGWATHSVTASVPFNFAAGNYRVGVKARLNSGATTGWLGERALIVSL